MAGSDKFTPVAGTIAETVTTPSWVSKNNVVGYWRCPFGFWLKDTKKVSKAGSVTVMQARLADAASSFRRHVLAEETTSRAAAAGAVGSLPTAVQAAPRQAADLKGSGVFLIGGDMYRNEHLHLIGSLSGIVASGGSAEPLEVKSHQEPTRLDLIELAFGWRLIEKLRTRSTCPAGWLWLRSPDGGVDKDRVKLTKDVFDELDELISGVRRARLEGVAPTMCNCAVCSGVAKDMVRAQVRAIGHLTAVSGISRRYADMLNGCGIVDWEGLHQADPEVVLAQMRAARAAVGLSHIKQWQAHAKALARGEPVWVSGPAAFPVPAAYIALDLEYNSDDKDVWMIGARVVSRRGDVTFSVYFEPYAVRRALSALAGLLESHPRLPVVTWNGLSADLPMLRATAERCGRSKVADEVASRHIDLYDWKCRTLRVPALGLGLKELSLWAGISRESSVRGGADANALREEYLECGDRRIRDRLVAYSRDDVDGLVQIVEALRSVAAGYSSPIPYQLRRPREVIQLVHEARRSRVRGIER